MSRTALITGSSRGIGRAIARELGRRGYDICVNYREQRQAAEELAAEIRRSGQMAVAIQADVADRHAVNAMVQAVQADLGPVSVLVNNAGISPQGLFQDMDDDAWTRCFAVNVNGARNAILAVLPHMLHEKSGCIVNISSIWGLRGASCETAYACTKAALIALTRSLALELAPSGIRVNCIAPGCIDTDMLRALGPQTHEMLVEQTPLGRLGSPDDIAHAAAFLVSPEAAFLTGQVLTLDGGFIV